MTGRDATIEAMAQRLGIKRDYLSAHMRVTYLAPDIVRALVSRQYPPELTSARLLSLCKDLPHDLAAAARSPRVRLATDPSRSNNTANATHIAAVAAADAAHRATVAASAKVKNAALTAAFLTLRNGGSWSGTPGGPPMDAAVWQS